MPDVLTGWVMLPDEHGQRQKVFPEDFHAHVERLRVQLLRYAACPPVACIHLRLSEELRERVRFLEERARETVAP